MQKEEYELKLSEATWMRFRYNSNLGIYPISQNMNYRKASDAMRELEDARLKYERTGSPMGSFFLRILNAFFAVQFFSMLNIILNIICDYTYLSKTKAGKTPLLRKKY